MPENQQENIYIYGENTLFVVKATVFQHKLMQLLEENSDLCHRQTTKIEYKQ